MLKILNITKYFAKCYFSRFLYELKLLLFLLKCATTVELTLFFVSFVKFLGIRLDKYSFGQSYQKQKGPGTSDQSLFGLQNKFRKIPVLVIYYLTKFDDIM